ncbi:MAG: DUF4397 domain-containing protein [Terracidiphilus sp.]
MTTIWNRRRTNRTNRINGERRLTLTGMAVAALALFAAAFGLAACENVASYTEPSLVRFIDVSYIAPAVNVNVEGTLIAGNIGQGTITPYATVPASNDDLIKIAAATTGGVTLVTAQGTLLAGHQHSVFLADNGAAPNGYSVTVLEDGQIAAPSGHSDFRFLNQAPATGPIDVYMVPSDSTLADSVPIVTALPVGAAAGYIGFASQTVTMVITPTGLTTPKYTSASLALTGGEVRTVLIYDSQLTSNPPVEVTMANDVD